MGFFYHAERLVRQSFSVPGDPPACLSVAAASRTGDVLDFFNQHKE